MKFCSILFILISFFFFISCHKDSETNECTLSKVVAGTVNNKVIIANHNVYASVGACPSYCPITTIQASAGVAPYDTTFNFSLFATSTTTCTLGKWGGKSDSTHMWGGEASYTISKGPSIREGYRTDSLFNGTLTITRFDKEKKEIEGTFNFIGRQLMTSDTITLQITNGSFKVCY